MGNNTIQNNNHVINTNTSKPDSQFVKKDTTVSTNGKEYSCAKVIYIYTPFLREDRDALAILESHISHFKFKGRSVKILVDSPYQAQALREYFKKENESSLNYIFDKSDLDDPWVKRRRDEMSKDTDEIMHSVCSDLSAMGKNDVLYINSHGAPQDKHFIAGPNTTIPANSSIFMRIFIKVSDWLCGPRIEHSAMTAQTLVKEFKLPPDAKIRTIGCNSAVGTGWLSGGVVFPWISKGFFWKKPWSAEQKLEYLRSHSGDFSKSLAGNLEAELIKRQADRKEGLVGGYLRETLLYPFSPDSENHRKMYAKNAEGNLVEAKSCFPVPLPKHSEEVPSSPAHFWGLLDGLSLSALLLGNSSVDINATMLVRRKDLLRTALTVQK